MASAGSGARLVRIPVRVRVGCQVQFRVGCQVVGQGQGQDLVRVEGRGRGRGQVQVANYSSAHMRIRLA